MKDFLGSSKDDEKLKKLSKIQIIKCSLHYFAILSKSKTYFIFIVVFATILKNFVKNQTDHLKTLLKTINSTNDMKSSFIKISLFNIHWAGMNFLTDYIFEKQLTPYGDFIALKILKHILFTDSRMINEVNGGEFEYYVTEGGKSMAKISRFIIFSFLSKIFHLIFGMYGIFRSDFSTNKIASFSFVASMLMLSTIKFFNMKNIVKFNKISMDISFEKEKN